MKLIRMNLGMKLFSCMWLGIQKYICLIQLVLMSMVRQTWVFQKEFLILKLQYAKTELSYDVDFVHTGRSWLKQQTDTVISSDLIKSLVLDSGH